MICGEKSMNSDNSKAQELVLASSSRYRRALLQRLGLRFIAVSPDVDESPQADEDISRITQRLAQAKAAALRPRFPQACIIGSDQLCVTTGPSPTLLGKPGTRDAAVQQLQTLSGRTVHFHTAVCVLQQQHVRLASDITQVRFRELTPSEIERYLDAEPEAIHCAGSFMSEALGISLCETISSDDPSALIGLPLIATGRLLREAGYAIP